MKTDFSGIKAILFDIDGVLTDGSISLDADGREMKTFHVRDGQLVGFMRDKGFLFGTISGRQSEAVKVRMKSLKIDFVELGITDKLKSYEAFLKKFSLKDKEVLFIGDDVIDIPVLERVGVAVAPADAARYLAPHVHLQTRAAGGKGVLREVIDLIIDQRGWNEWSTTRPGIGYFKN